MKKTILSIAITAFIAGTMITGCQSSADKVANAQDNVQAASNKLTKANEDLDQAIRDSIHLYKKETRDKIDGYDRDIAAYKVKIRKENSDSRDRDERRLAELEQKNNAMKRNLEEFREDSRGNWESFRNKMNRDMEETGRAFKDFWNNKR